MRPRGLSGYSVQHSIVWTDQFPIFNLPGHSHTVCFSRSLKHCERRPFARASRSSLHLFFWEKDDRFWRWNLRWWNNSLQYDIIQNHVLKACYRVWWVGGFGLLESYEWDYFSPSKCFFSSLNSQSCFWSSWAWLSERDSESQTESGLRWLEPWAVLMLHWHIVLFHRLFINLCPQTKKLLCVCILLPTASHVI